MKKYALPISIIGLVIQSFGIGVMLYGVNNNETFYKAGTFLLFLGMILVAVGIISTYMNRK